MTPKHLALAAIASATIATTAQAVTTYMETFDTNASAWLNGASTAAVYSTTGGVGDSGHISYTSSFDSGASGPFGAPPLQILMRGNNSADASGDAFVGNWLATGATVDFLTLSVRHNYTATLNLYARFDAGSGAAASLAFDSDFAIAPDTWTTISIPIVNSNPPFLSYGAGDFNSVFSNVQNLQFGLYVPGSTTFTDLKFDIDNVSITTIPETSSVALLGVGALGLLRRKRSH